MISSFIDVKIYIHNYFTDYFFGGGAKVMGIFISTTIVYAMIYPLKSSALCCFNALYVHDLFEMQREGGVLLSFVNCPINLW